MTLLCWVHDSSPTWIDMVFSNLRTSTSTPHIQACQASRTGARQNMPLCFGGTSPLFMYVSASFGALFDEASSPLLFMVLSAQPRDVLDVTGAWIWQAAAGRSYGAVQCPKSLPTVQLRPGPTFIQALRTRLSSRPDAHGPAAGLGLTCGARNQTCWIPFSSRQPRGRAVF